MEQSRWVAALGALVMLLCADMAPAQALPEAAVLQGWIADMKGSPRGPFSRIRWFCKDGSVLPPRPYACQELGGGVQHGEWSDQARQLRDNGFYVANVLAGLDAEAFVQREDALEVLSQTLVEQFLIRVDDGWIFRKARYYRGALQHEDEQFAARQLLLRLVADEDWLGRHFTVLRTAARYLHHGADSGSVAEIRQRSSDLAARDPGFERIRNKIHISPDVADAELVRSYAQGVADGGVGDDFEALAQLIATVYSPALVVEQLQKLARLGKGYPALADAARQGAERMQTGVAPLDRLQASAQLLAGLRDQLLLLNDPALRLAMLDTSLALEDAHFAAATALREQLPALSRKQHLALLMSGVEASYGVGLISRRQHAELADALKRLSVQQVSLSDYKQELDYLGLLPTWGSQRLRLHFQAAVHKLAIIEPRAELFIQESLRGSPLFFYVQALDDLIRDANRLVGVRKELFGREVGSGLRALNPGVAQGRLYLSSSGGSGGFAADGIYLLPESTAELLPVAGLLTLGEGNLLSHVQLLARNFGVPNVAVDEHLVPALQQAAGSQVLLAVSPTGSVRLNVIPAGDTALATEPVKSADDISPDLGKLDLDERGLIPLSQLRAGDSGRVVGPKAANLGELRHHFPEAVAEGLAIPFGVFRQLLDRPYGDSGKTVFEWMTAQYRALQLLPEGGSERAVATEQFRIKLHDWILTADPGDAFRKQLRTAMAQVFGEDGSYGVFVRSDTNIEDLPDFTGAGLNLTVPNVVGFEQVVTAISRVWASPFSVRAFAWRQGRMAHPEHVYPAVLLLRSVPSEKSGVLVTQDIDTGDAAWLSVAANEGVGGVVDGQAAESLRINRPSGEVRLMAQATVPRRRALKAEGGVGMLPVSGADTVLTPKDIAQLLELVQVLPLRFPPIVDADGKPAPADIEFGFMGGRLLLFQIRPFLESRGVRSSTILSSMDAEARPREGVVVDMDSPPGG